MFRRKLKNSFYLTIFLISIFSISFGYALLNSTLIIMGTSAIQKNTWDVHFDNLNITEGSVTATTAPSITDSNRISDFTFVLDKRGDYYEFTVDIVNSGSLDAMIDSVEMTPSLTTEQEKYLTYTITYENNEEIKKNQLVKVNDFVRIKVRVEFKSDITASDLPQTQQVLNLGFHINYVQADENGVVVNDNGIFYLIKIVSGDYDTVGSEIAIGDEHFYVISSDEDSVTMLAKQNITIDRIPKQTSEEFLVPFSDTAYWLSDDICGLKSEYDKDEPIYVYDSNSTQYEHIENYKIYLESKGLIIDEARLIKVEELEALGCSSSTLSCSNAPEWVYSMFYFTGSLSGRCKSLYYLNEYTLTWTAENYYYPRNVRPVIVIPKSMIELQ